MYNYLDELAGTQIRADGQRYDTGEGPDTPPVSDIEGDIASLQDAVEDLDDRVTVLEA